MRLRLIGSPTIMVLASARCERSAAAPVGGAGRARPTRSPLLRVSFRLRGDGAAMRLLWSIAYALVTGDLEWESRVVAATQSRRMERRMLSGERVRVWKRMTRFHQICRSCARIPCSICMAVFDHYLRYQCRCGVRGQVSGMSIDPSDCASRVIRRLSAHQACNGCVAQPCKRLSHQERGPNGRTPVSTINERTIVDPVYIGLSSARQEAQARKRKRLLPASATSGKSCNRLSRTARGR